LNDTEYWNTVKKDLKRSYLISDIINNSKIPKFIRTLIHSFLVFLIVQRR